MDTQIPHVELAESAYKLEWMDDPWAAIDSAGEWLRTLVQRYAADVVHCNGFALAAVSFGVPVLCDAHSSIVVWARAIRGRERGPEWDEYRARAAGGLRAAAEVVGPTRTSLEAILDAHGVRRTGRVIPHGLSASAYRATYDELLAARRAPHLAADHGRALASSAALGSKPEL